MSAATNAFHWAGQPSIFVSDNRFVPSAQGRSTTPPKSHPLRNAEAQKIVRAKGAAI